jgi:hypothetical protein
MCSKYIWNLPVPIYGLVGLYAEPMSKIYTPSTHTPRSPTKIIISYSPKDENLHEVSYLSGLMLASNSIDGSLNTPV